MENSFLLNISSSYIIKKIFSNIEYNRFISLIKYSKEYQNNLGFNLKNNIHYNKSIEKNSKVEFIEDWGDGLGLIAYFPYYAPLYIYFFIYYILNNISNIELNNDAKSNGLFWSIVFGIIIKRLSILLYIGSIYVLYHTILHFRFDYINTKKKYIILYWLLMFIHVCYELLLIYKIIIIASYAIKGKWMILFDVIYLIANISFIYFVFTIFQQYLKCKEYPEFNCYNNLVLFKDIKIKEYKLPKNFESFRNKRKFIESKVNYFEINYNIKDLVLIADINLYRLKKNLDVLIIDYKIPNFIIKGSTEIILFPNNIIKISNIKYVFSLYAEDDFEEIKGNKNIINILIKPFMNKINIIRQKDIRYITIYEDYDNEKYETIQIKDNLENEKNMLLKENTIYIY